MRFKQGFGLLLVFVLLLSLCACGGEGEGQPESGKHVVAVSIPPEETFVKEVCGDLAEIVVMIPPGYSPENYEPTPKEMVRFSEAELYFTIGVPAEEQGILPAVAEGTKVVPLHDICAEEYAELQMNGGRDPHVWLSPKRAAVMVGAIADEMSALDPDNAQVYEDNAQAYADKLLEADGEISDMLSSLTERSFIVFHPAFGYFADDYGLEMLALEENGREATAERLRDMTDFAREHKIKVIFYQAEIDSRQSETFADEIGGEAVKLDPLSSDYINNLKAMAQAISEGVG